MPVSDYIRRLRNSVGHQLLLMPSVTILTFDTQGRVLLVKHADKGLWVTPGGSIEPNETPADAAVREMWEETGLFVELTHILGVYGGPDFQINYTNGDQVTYLMTVFEADVQSGYPKSNDTEEILDMAYVSQAELASLETAAWVKIVLNDAFENRNKRTKFHAPTWKPPARSG